VTYIAADGDTDVLHWDKMLEFCRLSVSLTRENRLTASPSAQCPHSDHRRSGRPRTAPEFAQMPLIADTCGCADHNNCEPIGTLPSTRSKMLGLLFAYQRSSLGDTSFHQVGLDLQLLMWSQIRDCLKWQVTRKCDADAMLSRR
jgi:hypothetical protein